MTRFARAKGSKSSNEKQPEEGTSWSEMRTGMLLKNIKTPESVPAKEIKIPPKKTTDTEWASLGDDSSTLLGLHLKKKDKIVRKNEKKKAEISECGSNLSAEVVKSNKIKIEKCSVESVNSKRGKKRKFKEMSNDDLNESKKCSMETANSKKKKLKEVSGNNGDLNELPKIKNKKVAKSLDVNKKNRKRDFERKFEKGGKGGKNCFTTKQGKGGLFNKKSGRRTDFFNGENKIVEEIMVNGEKVPIVKFQGFNVTLEDAERLRKLRREMIKEGIPKDKLEAAIKLERRRAEKALSRLKKAVCFHCRGSGHLLSNCPTLAEKETTSTGICYKCGSTEHSAVECKVVRGTNFQFAECFICKEQGHIARQCPDNPRGLYPQGGGCRECGDVTHLRKDCPRVASKKPEEVVTVGVRRDRDFECLDEEIEQREKLKLKTVNKKSLTVKF